MDVEIINTKAGNSKNSADGRSERRLQNSARLYDAGMKLLEKNSYHAITADDICREANVGRATFFRIYKTKAGLLREFNRRMSERISVALTENKKAGGGAGTDDALAIVTKEIALSWQSGGAGLAGMLTDYMQSPKSGDVHSAHPELLVLVSDIMKQGIESGDIPADADADFLASLALSTLSIAVVHGVLNKVADIENFVFQALDRFLYGLVVS